MKRPSIAMLNRVAPQLQAFADDVELLNRDGAVFQRLPMHDGYEFAVRYRPKFVSVAQFTIEQMNAYPVGMSQMLVDLFCRQAGALRGTVLETLLRPGVHVDLWSLGDVQNVHERCEAMAVRLMEISAEARKRMLT